VIKAIFVVNSGSTSLKFGVFLLGEASALSKIFVGRIDSMQGAPRFVVKDAAGNDLHAHEWRDGNAIDHRAALHFILTWLEDNLGETKIIAAGHRILLGGMRLALSH
jgi:acetate kinase